MRIGLYLTEDLRYFNFEFQDGEWYWLVSEPGGKATQRYGPFNTPLKVPAPDFMAASGARYGNTWKVTGTECHSWVIPTAKDHGIWYSFRSDDGNLSRIFSFDTDNPIKIPILGSYYLAHVAQFNAIAQSDDLVHSEDGPALEASSDPGPMVTQEDIQRALAKPLHSEPCTLEQIQALIPGLVPTPSATLPVWSEKTAIKAWTLGSDLIPYRTFVHYWYSQGQQSHGRQQSWFVGLGLEPGHGSYDQMATTCLYSFPESSKDYMDGSLYEFAENQWRPKCCEGTYPELGAPRPDWVAADNGQIAASITGNPAFGCKPGEVVNLIRCPLERGQGEEALFWVWFTGAQEGVLFTEANFVNSTDHSLQLIDYELFERDANWITEESFEDPCPSLPACPTAEADQTPQAHKVFGPHGRSQALTT